MEDELLLFSEKSSRIAGVLQALPEQTKDDLIVDIILAGAIKTSEIEGEYPGRIDVLSSIRKNLGLLHSPDHIKDKSTVGLAELMINVRKSFKDPLTEKTILNWHNMLLREAKNIQVGQWRAHEEPMQIISGAMGKVKVHFQAPPSAKVFVRSENWFTRYQNHPGIATSLGSNNIFTIYEDKQGVLWGGAGRLLGDIVQYSEDGIE